MNLRLAALLATALFAGAASAGSFSDLVMAPGLFTAAPEGEVLSYSLTRSIPTAGTPAQGAPSPVAEGQVALSLVPGEGGEQLTLSRTEDGKTWPDISFPASGPNPLLLFFLENTVRAVAAETGGSPFYIRNRIREALGTAEIALGPGQQTLILTPFATDPNRPRMGAFGDLAIAITFDPAEPGRIVELKADTTLGTAGYTELLRLNPNG